MSVRVFVGVRVCVCVYEYVRAGVCERERKRSYSSDWNESRVSAEEDHELTGIR